MHRTQIPGVEEILRLARHDGDFRIASRRKPADGIDRIPQRDHRNVDDLVGRMGEDVGTAMPLDCGQLRKSLLAQMRNVGVDLIASSGRGPDSCNHGRLHRWTGRALRGVRRFRYHDAVRTPLVPVALIAAATVMAGAQTQPPLRDHRPYRSGIEITSITATVTDRDGHLIPDLPRDAFEVFEDGERQTITQFTHERVPVGLGVLLDISDSMFGKRIGTRARRSIVSCSSCSIRPTSSS